VIDRNMSRRESMNTIIGIDIGGTKTAIVEGTSYAEILQRCEIPTRAEIPFADSFPHLVEMVENLVAAALSAGRNVSAISISVGGPLRVVEGILLDPPHLPGWHNVPLRRKVEERFPNLPVRVEHDGNAGALAEFNFGIGKRLLGLKHLVFLTLGTGLGAGIILNGQLVRGATDMAGEVGHMRVAAAGPVGYGKRGSWEAFCSGAGMLQLAKDMYPSLWDDEASIANLVNSMLLDHKEALSVARESGAWLGRGLALLVDSLNPEVIALGSLGVVLGDRLIEPAMQTLRAEALPHALDGCRIVPAKLGTQLGDVASLMAALNDQQLKANLSCPDC
jgi:glucokinase